MVSQVSLHALESLLPTALLEELAVRMKLDASHEIRLTGRVAFLCLLNSLLNHPELTQRLLEEEYARQTGRTADHSTFSRWLSRSHPAYFRAIFTHLYEQLAARDHSTTQGEINALRLRLVDATVVTLSAKLLHFGLLYNHANQWGKQPRQYRHVKAVFELSGEGLPHLLHICREQAEVGDSRALGLPMQQQTQPGDLWVFDRGCHSRERLLNIHEAGGYFLTPHHQQQSFRIAQTLLVQEPPPEQRRDPTAFYLVRVEQAIFENSYRNALSKRLAGMPLLLLHGLRFDGRSKQWVPMTLMTNLPLSADRSRTEPYLFEELAVLYKRRWEIEVFFKFLKQHLGYKHLTSRSENGITIMIWMSLIGALLLIWYKRQTNIDRGWKSVKFWLAEDARAWTQIALANAFQSSG